MKWRMGGSSANVEDRRGMRMVPGGLGGLGLGGVLVLLVLSFVFKQDFLSLVSGTQGGTVQQVPIETTPAEDSLKEFVTFVLNDAQEAWNRILPQQANTSYQDSRLVLFRDAVQSGCGAAQSATGPFYCPADGLVYIDLGFYHELHTRFGAEGDFAQAYVLAHEIGHHVQNLVGTAAQVQQAGRSNELSVRLELQADCYAGIWASTTRDRQLLDPGDVEEGLGAAAAVGDDRIQRMGGQVVNPESWTHGSAEQRAEWFRRGFNSGRMQECDTFSR